MRCRLQVFPGGIAQGLGIDVNAEGMIDQRIQQGPAVRGFRVSQTVRGHAFARASYPSQAQPGPFLHCLLRLMQLFPHA